MGIIQVMMNNMCCRSNAIQYCHKNLLKKISRTSSVKFSLDLITLLNCKIKHLLNNVHTKLIKVYHNQPLLLGECTLLRVIIQDKLYV